jgi:tripartite-type tricarboxylate transporter receptor subunit TctC
MTSERRRPPYLAWGVIVLSLAALLVMRLGRSTEAANFPGRPVTIICPYAAGGGTDLFARGLARAAEKQLGETVVVNNLTGGAGALGHAAGIAAAPDGYTVTAVTFELISLPLQGLVPFTHEDFDLLMRVNEDPAALAVRKDFPAETLGEFFAWAKEKGGVQIANSGTGSAFHLASAKMAEATGIPARHIPFNGANPAITAVVGGHVDAVVAGPGEMQVQREAGNLKILGVMSEERLALFPEIPTFREAGHEVVFGTWRGLAVPTGTPQLAREKLSAAFLAAAADPEFLEFARRGGLNIKLAEGEPFREAVRGQSGEVAELMDRLNLR